MPDLVDAKSDQSEGHGELQPAEQAQVGLFVLCSLALQQHVRVHGCALPAAMHVEMGLSAAQLVP
jgi:hypothetical protein